MSFPSRWSIAVSDVRTRRASTIQTASRVHSVRSGAAETDLQASGLIRGRKMFDEEIKSCSHRFGLD